jgi:hypothetical protein
MAENKDKDKEPKREKVVLPADFDLQGYAAQYKGHARVVRLAHIADACEALQKVSSSTSRRRWGLNFFLSLCRRR